MLSTFSWNPPTLVYSLQNTFYNPLYCHFTFPSSPVITMTSPQQHIWHVKATWALFLKREMQVELRHTRSDHWPYLCKETHTYWDLMRKNTPGVNIANCLSNLLWDSHCGDNPCAQKHIWLFCGPSFAPPSLHPLHLPLRISVSIALCQGIRTLIRSFLQSEQGVW